MRHLRILLLLSVIGLAGCESSTPTSKTPNTIIHQADGRTVKHGDPFPIALDLNGDGRVDYTIFVELTANSLGDRLYAGMNPIGANLIKSGPANDANFQNMGLLVAETPGATIDAAVGPGQEWTGDFSALVIRNTFTNGTISYEGAWAEGERIVGIRHVAGTGSHYGWLRIRFDKTTEIVTLVDHAYNTTAEEPIQAGATSN